MNIELLTIMFVIMIIFALVEINFSAKNYNYLYFIFAIIISLIFSFRELYSPDTLAYVDAYNNIDLFEISNTNVRDYELGFVFLMSIIKYIFGNDYKIFFFFTSIISYIIMYFTLKDIFVYTKSKNKYYISALVLYTSFYGIYYQGIVLRAGIAILLYYYSLVQLSKKKYLKFILISIASILFHKSIIFALPMSVFFLFKKKYSYIFYNILIFVVLFFVYIKIYLLISPILLTQINAFVTNYLLINDYEIYLSLGDFGNKIEYKSAYYIIIGFIFANQKINDYNYTKLLNIYMLGLFLSIFIGTFNNMNRILDLFRIIYIYIFVFNVSYWIEYNNRSKLLYSMLIVIFVIVNYTISCLNIFTRL